MRVLLFVGLLALVEARGRYKSPLQDLEARQQETYQERIDQIEKINNIIKEYIVVLTADVEDLKTIYDGLAKIHTKQLDDIHEHEPSRSDANARDNRGEKAGPNRDDGDNQQNAQKRAMRMLVQKIQSLKREQSQMKLSDGLTRVLKERR
ncbi:hypothetical protein CHS0354_001874 [Potamilus streckersoni]|uniref:Uncharacterized protein n=1 Tax=Potamilus streckersoni TaxID=2493646 RepID=A0AAE0TFZ2_9BIVA|nr:hypothetical protein CHS0354_001874 [Potamilus streckersoni]